MTDEKTKNLFAEAISVSIEAGKAILEVYTTDFDVELKEDRSPLTLADKRSHEKIESVLQKTDYPILSEEGKEVPYETRKNWNKFWMVHPLDGTKEFIKRNGEFTVNIALINGILPEFGIIYVPVHKELYFGGKDFGSFKVDALENPLSNLDAYLNASQKLPLVKENETYTVIGSRSHMSEETEAYFNKVRASKGEIEVFSRGSSLKLCMVAEGAADEYPRFAPTMEWDVAAGQAIIEGAGKNVFHYKSGEVMRYNRENLVNSWFVAKKE